MLKRILIVDDEEYIRANLRIFLEDEGYRVNTASSAEEALTILDTEDYDVGVIDIRLPDRDGNQLIALASKVHPKMKFIIHTGSSEYALPTCLKEKGLSNKNILLKPLVNMNQLTACIESV